MEEQVGALDMNESGGNQLMGRTRAGYLPAILILAGLFASSRASVPEGPWFQETDTTTFDQLDRANTAPGLSDVAVGGGAAVSSFNGNLQITVPMSTVLPQDGRLPSIAFGLTYNSTNAKHYRVRDDAGYLGYSDWLSGRSWVGWGWTGHLGRIYRIAKYKTNASGWDYSDFETRFEFPDGSLFQFEPEVKNAHPNLKIEYFRDCVDAGPPPTCNICQTHPYAACCENPPTDNPNYYLCSNRPADRVEHYNVTFPNGTVYRLEKIVPYDYAQPNGLELPRFDAHQV